MGLPEPRYDREGIKLFAGDALAILPEIEAGSVDAVVTDPPAGIAFMGKEWDRFGGRANANAEQDRATANAKLKANPNRERGTQPFGYSGSSLSSPAQRSAFIGFLSAVLAECFRVAKPGSRLLCWAIPRTSHWTGTAIEDAGWVVEDRISHLHGQGFPKHASKLKPACEDWWLAWKPDRKATALNIDACRIKTDDDLNGGAYAASGTRSVLPGDERSGKALGMLAPGKTVGEEFQQPAGRWPANLVLSHHPDCQCVGTKRVKGCNGWVGWKGGPGNALAGSVDGALNVGPDANQHADSDGLETVSAWRCVEGCPVAELDRQSGALHPGGWPARRGAGGISTSGHKGQEIGVRVDSDSGGASRFFYCPKASRSDRGEGNTHPTVKNTDLMRWLCRLIAKPGDMILDPFAGSGSTLLAAYHEGMRAIGVEREVEYVEMACNRLREAETPLFSALTG
jgi:DNA modification methylase